MNLNEISIWVGKVFDGLYIGWPYKTMLGIVFLALERHLELFTAFACIVCVDLFAKFIALSYGYLAESMTEKPSLIDSVKGIPAAHRAGVINSRTMRMQFVEKISVYMLLVVAGALVDFMLGRSEFANLVIAYLASSELLSIVENLDDAGVSAVHDLAALVKRRGGSHGYGHHQANAGRSSPIVLSVSEPRRGVLALDGWRALHQLS